MNYMTGAKGLNSEEQGKEKEKRKIWVEWEFSSSGLTALPYVTLPRL